MYSHNERIYLKRSLPEIKTGDFCSLPVMFNTGYAKLLFTEASLINYPGMFLKKDDEDQYFKNYADRGNIDKIGLYASAPKKISLTSIFNNETK